MASALAHDFVGFLAVFGRHNIRPPHFASKVSYSASPQGIVAPYYLAKKRSFFLRFCISKVSDSALATEIYTDPHNRLLRRQHCSSLCSQSEGHEHVANMGSASGHDFVGISARAWPPQYSSPSLCEQSELQCFALGLRCMFAQRRPLKGRVFKIQIQSSLAAVPSQRRIALARIIVCCGASIVAHFARKVRATNT